MGWAEGATFPAMAASWQTPLAQTILPWIINPVSAQQVIEEFKALPPAERAQVAKFVMEQDDSWVPESFKEGMKAAAEGRFVDMETALFETPPPHLR